MIRTFLLLTLLVFSTAQAAESIRLSEPVAEDEFSETFGHPLNDALPVVSLANLLTESPAPDQFQLTVRISKVCKKKGCFFIAQEGKHVVRVSFRDYGFFVPTDSNGKIVTLAGALITKQLTDKQAEHFNKDIGQAGVINPGEVYEIVADSVKIPKA